MADITEKELDTLEAIIDRCGLRETLLAISGIADAKVTYIEENCQDAELASCWNDAALIVRRAADAARVKELP